jgi:hypothetical protein
MKVASQTLSAIGSNGGCVAVPIDLYAAEPEQSH